MNDSCAWAKRAGASVVLFATAMVLIWLANIIAFGSVAAESPARDLIPAFCVLYFGWSTRKGSRRAVKWALGFSLFYAVIGVVLLAAIHHPIATAEGLMILAWSLLNTVWLFKALRQQHRQPTPPTVPGVALSVQSPPPICTAAESSETNAFSWLPTDQPGADGNGDTPPVNGAETVTNTAAPQAQGVQTSVGRAFKAATWLLLALNVWLSILVARHESKEVAAWVGRGFGPILGPLIVAAVLSIWKRFRTTSAKYKAVLYASVFVFVGTVGRIDEYYGNSFSITHLIASAPPAKVEIPDENACVEFAKKLEQTLTAGDGSFMDAHWDFDLLIERMLGGRGISQSSLRRFREGMESASRSSGGWGSKFAANCRAGGRFTYLRTRNVNGQMRTLFRGESNDTGVDYCDFLLISKEGQVRIADVYTFSNGEFMSDTLRRMALPVLLSADDSVLGTLSATEREYVKAAPQMASFVSTAAKGDYDAVVRTYNQLPPVLKKDKSVMLIRLRMAAAGGADSDYQQALDEMKERFPNDPALNLLLFDRYVSARQFAKAHACIQALREATGGDDFLDALGQHVTGLEAGADP